MGPLFTRARVWVPALLLLILFSLAWQTGEWRDAGIMAGFIVLVALIFAYWDRNRSGPAQ